MLWRSVVKVGSLLRGQFAWRRLTAVSCLAARKRRSIVRVLGLSKSGVGNLQGIAGHIARMIFSAGHICVSCANNKKSSPENLVKKKKVITSAEAQFFAQKQAKSKKRSIRPQTVI